MRLYVYPHSAVSRKVLFAVHEKGLTIERHIVPPYDEAGKAKLREVYPLATVPMLVLADGTSMPESSIIVEYLDQRFPHEPLLVPRDPALALQARAFDRIGDILFDGTQYLAWSLRKPAAEQHPGKIAASFKSVRAALALLDAKLASHRYLVGDGLSLADLGPHCAAAAMVTDGILANLDEWPGVARWSEALAGRPAWQQVRDDCIGVPLPPEIAATSPAMSLPPRP